MQKVFNLIDTGFSHHRAQTSTDSTVAGIDSSTIVWDRSLSDLDRPSFYSHETILSSDKKTKNNYGLIFESRAIIPQTYSMVEKHIPEFRSFYTHNSEFLKKYEKCKWIPGGGIWIGGKFGLGEIAVHKKSKLCSMVSSGKAMCNLHIARQDYFNRLQSYKFIDFFGCNTGWTPIARTLEDYMFSIAVENFVDELYFTEKILNCFATGTIPIYQGARDIEKLFNIEGIVRFNNFEELEQIVNSITPDYYLSRMGAIHDNFERCKNYRCIEDFIMNNYNVD